MLIITLNPYKIVILVRSINRLTLIYYFKELFKIVVKEIVIKNLKGLLVLKGLIGKKIRETL